MANPPNENNMPLTDYNTNTAAICECGCKRFKTVEKNLLWKCRKCGQLRAYINETRNNNS